MDFDTFLNELKRWKLNTESMYRVKMEDMGDLLQLSFCIPNTNEEYVCIVKKDKITQMQTVFLMPITISAVRISETMKSAQVISNKIQEVEDAKNSSQPKGKNL